MNQNSHSEIIQLCNQCQNPLEKARFHYSSKSKCNKCIKLRQREYEKNKPRIKGGNRAWKALKS